MVCYGMLWCGMVWCGIHGGVPLAPNYSMVWCGVIGNVMVWWCTSCTKLFNGTPNNPSAPPFQNTPLRHSPSIHFFANSLFIKCRVGLMYACQIKQHSKCFCGWTDHFCSLMSPQSANRLIFLSLLKIRVRGDDNQQEISDDNSTIVGG